MTKKIDIQSWTNQGFNESQATSLAWADHFQDRMDKLAYDPRFANSFFGPEIRIDCYCQDCKQGGQFLPDTTRDFIIRHKNHKTKTIKLR